MCVGVCMCVCVYAHVYVYVYLCVCMNMYPFEVMQDASGRCMPPPLAQEEGWLFVFVTELVYSDLCQTQYSFWVAFHTRRGRACRSRAHICGCMGTLKPPLCGQLISCPTYPRWGWGRRGWCGEGGAGGGDGGAGSGKGGARGGEGGARGGKGQHGMDCYSTRLV